MNKWWSDPCEPHHVFSKNVFDDWGVASKVECERCGFICRIGGAKNYAQGFNAAGGNAEMVLPDWKSR